MAVRHADVVVAGNGVLGLSIAVEVARRAPEARVVVVGPRDQPVAASTAAGAMVNCFGEVTTGTAAHPVARAKFAIARHALDLWPQWLDMLGDTAGDVPRVARTSGTTVVLSGRSGGVAVGNFEAMRAALVEHGEPHDVLDPSEVPGLAPEFGARPSHAVHLCREGSVDARATVVVLAAAARRLGVELVEDTVRALTVAGGAVCGVLLGGGSRIATGTVVLAAGSGSRELADAVLPPGAVPPVWHGAGLALLTEQPSTDRVRHVVRTPNRAAACGLHLVPLSDQLYVGATNIVTPDPTPGPDIGSSQAFLRAVCEQFDHRLGARHVLRWLHGVRPVSIDGFPLIGRCGVNGLVFATGTHRDGFHCSPAIAAHLAHDILHGPSADERFACFTPERAPIQTMSLDEAVTEAAAHLIDAAGEYGLSLPFMIDADSVRDWAHQRARRLYDRLGVALPPEVVVVVRALTDPNREALLSHYVRAAERHHSARSSDPADTFR